MIHIFKFTMTLLIILSFSSQNLNALTRSQLQYPFYNNVEEECSVNTTEGDIIALKRLYILGDSITLAAKNNISNDMEAAGLSVVKINADGGRAIYSDTYPPGTSAMDEIKTDGNLSNDPNGVNIISSADAAVIALGTNSGNEDLTVAIPELVNEIRKAKPNIPIFWVNLFYNVNTSVTRDQRNAIITEQASMLPDMKVIDTVSAGIELEDDQTHPTTTGNSQFSKVMVDNIKNNLSFIPGNDRSENGNSSHILTYPGITDEVAAAQAIDDYLSSNFPASPLIGLGKYFISGAKKSNVNPFLALGHVTVENGAGTASGGWHKTTPPSYNAFGREANPKTQPYVTYVTSSGKVRTPYRWPSWEASLDGTSTDSDDWFMAIRRNYLNESGPYYSTTFEKYMSHYAPNSDGNDENSYISKLKKVIDDVTSGLSITGGGINSCGGTSIPSTGDASKYISDCGANEGNAAIACTAINQLMGLPYNNTVFVDPSNPSPSFLDCSGFTKMAVYRTFGVNLGGICSTGHLTDPNFERIDVRDIKPGDMVGKGTDCNNSGGGGHIAIVVSYNKDTKELVTVEASSKNYPSGIRGGADGSYPVSLAVDGLGGSYIWAVRYVGQKILQEEAMLP